MALLFNDERATKAVLSFLRKTKVGQMVTAVPRDGQEGEEGEEPREREEVGGEEAPHPRFLKGGASGGGRLQGEKYGGGGFVLCVLVCLCLGTPVHGGASP